MAWIGTAAISGIVGSLTSFVVGKAVEVAKSLSLDDLVEELESLELNLCLIKDLLDDAESQQNKQAGVRLWLAKLKDAAYDAEDVLDEYTTDVAILLQSENPVKVIIEKINERGLKDKIKHISKRFDQLSKARNNFGLRKLETSNEQSSRNARGRESSSLLDVDSPIIGRDGVKNKIIALLTSNGIENSMSMLPVLPVVGMGGLGKTSLAQLVFHDEDVKKHFSLRIWIFVSQDFDVDRMLRSIIEYVYADRGERKRCMSTSLESLHNETKELIEKRKFLLILDDAWNDKQQHWHDLLKPLKFGDNGSKVLVTTRSETVAESIDGHMNLINLDAIDDKYIWEILEGCAFKGIDNPRVKQQLTDTGKKIVGKIKGSPLAANTIGRLLGTRLDKDHWMSILESNLWEVEGQQEHDILPSLWLSYQHLPLKLKICFSFCSLFPKGYQISKEELSYLWIAHGIFQVGAVGHGNSALGAIQDLRSRSLLSQGKDDDFLTMHDLIHDVSEFVAQEDHLHITDNIKLEKLPNKLRHLSFSSLQWESKFSCDKLRSVLCIKLSSYYVNRCKLEHSVLDSWLNKSTCLRVLNLQGCEIGVLPKSIGNLKHLRCLNLSGTYVSKLPKSLTSLYNLQALWLEDCSWLNKLPDGMGNLVNLRLLRIDEQLSHTIKGIKRLSSLQVLRYFSVYPEYGSGIEELEKLDMLGGDLTISCLENVVDPDQARNACLERKECLQGLTLEWSTPNASNRIAEEVLEALQPNGDVLKCLKIERYGGRVFPSWLSQDGHLPASLQKLIFNSCERLQSLPLAMRGLSNLQTLELKKCHQMQSLPDMTLPASLQHLDIDDCESLTSLPSDMTRLTSLQRLWLQECPKIISLADIGLPVTLQELEIKKCESLVSLPSDMTRLTSLQSLRLRECPKIESLADIGLPASLLDLKILDCESLTSLPSDMTRLTSLQSFSLSKCPKKESLADIGLPASLQQLEIDACESLASLPSDLTRLTSLQSLRLRECPKIESLADTGLPVSLQQLEIDACESLASLPSDMTRLTSLHSICLFKCQKIESLADIGLPASLQHLEIDYCESLTSLPSDMALLTSLRSLWLNKCPRLQSFPESGIPPSLTSMYIQDCPGLQSYPECCLPPLLSTLRMISYRPFRSPAFLPH